MNFNRLEQIARALQPANSDSRFYHCSFIMDKSKIAAIGLNNYKTHPKNLHLKFLDRNGEDISNIVGTHSELSAVIKMGREDCRKYKLINIRIDRMGNLTNSKPCEGCTNLVRQVGFREVWYSFNSDFIKLVDFNNLQHGKNYLTLNDNKKYRLIAFSHKHNGQMISVASPFRATHVHLKDLIYSNIPVYKIVEINTFLAVAQECNDIAIAA